MIYSSLIDLHDFEGKFCERFGSKPIRHSRPYSHYISHLKIKFALQLFMVYYFPTRLGILI